MSGGIKLALLIFLTLALWLTSIGCNGELSQEEIEQIVEDAVAANANVETLSFYMNAVMDMEVVSGDEPVEMGMLMDGAAIMDIMDKEMQMLMTMSMDIPGEGIQDVATEIYITGGWMYMQMDVPPLGEQWLKVEMTDDIWQQQNQFEQQIEMLRTAEDISYYGIEEVDSVACYVVGIEPSMETVGELLSQQQTAGMQGLDYAQLDMGNIVKEMTIKEWIAQDGYLVRKTEVVMFMEMGPGDIGASQGDFEHMSMDMDMTMKLCDYNKPVTIELPAGASQAMEMPGM